MNIKSRNHTIHILLTTHSCLRHIDGQHYNPDRPNTLALPWTLHIQHFQKI